MRISFNAYNITIVKRAYPVTAFPTRVLRVPCHVTSFTTTLSGGRYTEPGYVRRVTSDLPVILKC
jgi:hypothetical protein